MYTKTLHTGPTADGFPEEDPERAGFSNGLGFRQAVIQSPSESFQRTGDKQAFDA